jgi:uncharacterized membrane protein
MSEQELVVQKFEKEPSSSLVSLVFIIYGLHGFSALTGVMTPAFVLTAFLTGWPSIIAVILSYAKKDDADGTYLASHFEWTITTFWYAAFAIVIAGVMFVTIVGIPLGIVIIIFTGLWVLYRIIRGVLNLLEEKPLPLD